MDTEIVVALVGFVGSLIVAGAASLFAIGQARESNRLQLETATRLKKLEDELQEKAAARDAQLEYKYEALKDLYKTAEPILFQLHELCQLTYYRTLSLARIARQGDLDGPESWLSGPSYYMVSTVYAYLAPLAVFRLLQRRVTFIDIGLEASIGRRYYIARAIYSMFTEHHELALNFAPKLEYDPNHKDGAKLQGRRPDVYTRQGVPGQLLEAAADAMLVRDGDGLTRLKTYHEFAVDFAGNSKKKPDPIFAAFQELFLDFHPRTRPVLWRILIAQACLCELFVKSRTSSEWHPWADIGDFELSDPEIRARFDWRKEEKEATREEALEVPFAVAHAYLRSRVSFALKPGPGNEHRGVMGQPADARIKVRA